MVSCLLYTHVEAGEHLKYRVCDIYLHTWIGIYYACIDKLPLGAIRLSNNGFDTFDRRTFLVDLTSETCPILSTYTFGTKTI